MERKCFWLWLSRIPNIGTKRFLSIYEYFQNIEEVYYANKEELSMVPNLNKVAIDSILNHKNLKDTLEYAKKLEKQKVDTLLLEDEEYPKLLKQIYDPPPVLYCKGSTVIDEVAISIVGSRKASYYGLKMAEKLAFELASMGITIVSGMARGIDTYAHKGALQAKGKTVAVLGCGVDVIYPVENKELMQEIELKGSVISEYPLSILPKPNFFPARNRIISGLSLGTIIIEAGEKSGSLITAEFALEQGREVYAIPGNIDTTTSKGTNNLIKEGAKVVTKVEDIIEDIFPYLHSKIDLLSNRTQDHSAKQYEQVTEEEKIILMKIKNGFNTIDDIIRECGYPTSTVNACLTMLELKGIIIKYIDGYYLK
ncbi:DNA-processing protein DprA [Irregularibacter muris]|uniref:DNA-processing protein DprA n=1 Tax=Irregularibacter muris TaxID=1796619 RepID=A0AAE3L290_9FIRM|nr:DNA-processing protein DprA [Irregularibacter muris]MCR1898124.1 DNA-processing protein DprA [Irregularibacter muris]